MSLDMVVLRLREERLELLLETRDRPLAHCWQLPALRIDEARDRDLDAARHRLLAEWGLEHCYSEQVCTLGNLERDPAAGPPPSSISVWRIPMGAVRGRWHPLDDLPGLQLAFDHGKLVAMGLERLRIKSRYSTLPLHLLGQNSPSPRCNGRSRSSCRPHEHGRLSQAAPPCRHPGGHRAQAHRQATSRHPLSAGDPCCVMFDQVMHGAEA